MRTINDCIAVTTAISDQDADELLRRVDELRASGIAPADAQRTAAADLLAEIDADAAELRGLVRDQHQDLFRAPPAPPEKYVSKFFAAEPQPKPTPVQQRSMLEDMTDQAIWLESKARAAGYASTDALLARDTEAFMALAAQWRAEHPVDDIRYSRVPQRFALRQFGAGAATIEAIQDRYNRWKQTIEDVRAQGGTVTEENDFYATEERYWGKVGARVDDFANEVEQFVADVTKDGLMVDDVAKFAYALHARERNAYIAGKRPDMQDGGSGIDNATAQAMLDDARNAGVYDLLDKHAQTLQRWTTGTRDIMLDGGLITEAEYLTWNAMFDHYVPLRGLEGREQGGGRRGTGSGFSVGGKESKEAKGRYSEARQIIEQIIQDRSRALIRSGKNEVARAFGQFVLDNPDRGLWEVQAVESRPAITVDANGNRVIEEVRQTVTDERTVSFKDGGRTIHVLVHDEKLREQLKNLNADMPGRLLASFMLPNRIMGRLYTSLSPTFTVLNAARDVQAAMFGIIDEVGFLAVPKLLAKLPGAFSAAAAAEMKKPSAEFQLYRSTGGKTGFFDFRTLDQQTKELETLVAKSEQGALDPRRMGRAALGVIEGINGAVENATRFAAFQVARESGKSVAEAARISKNITVNFNRKGTWTNALGAWFLFFNPAVQGSARIIKSLRHPKVLATLGAAMTGVAALAIRNAAMGDDDDGVAWWDKIPDEIKERNLIIVLPPGAEGGEAVPGSKVGRYIKVPMPYGYNFFAVIAMQAVDAWRHTIDNRRGRSPLRAAMKAVNAFMGSWIPVAELGKAIDTPQSAVLAAVPDVLNPLAQNALNVSPFGRRMYPDDRASEAMPDSARFFAGQAGTIFQRGAQALNRAAGGSAYTSAGDKVPVLGDVLDMTPASLENLVRAYGGGPATFTLDILNAIYARQAIERPTPDVRRLPFVKQVYGQIDAETDRQAAYLRLEEAEKASTRLKRAQREGAAEEAQQILKDAGPIAVLGTELGKLQREMGELRKLELQVVGSNVMTDAEKFARLSLLNGQRRQLLQGFNRLYDRSIELQQQREKQQPR